MKKMKKNNKGFSLVELIVIIAIMAIATGGTILSVSLVTGAEARKAFQKIDAELNEVKTESMTRYGETLVIKYLDRSSLDTGSGVVVSNVNEKGYYGTKALSTLTTGSGVTPVGHRYIGEENRLLCNDRVTITLWYGDNKSADPNDWKDGLSSFTLGTDDNSYISFEYNRANGLFNEVKVGNSSGASTVTPQFLECTSGMRTYRMEFFAGTGKHKQVE